MQRLRIQNADTSMRTNKPSSFKVQPNGEHNDSGGAHTHPRIVLSANGLHRAQAEVAIAGALQRKLNNECGCSRSATIGGSSVYTIMSQWSPLDLDSSKSVIPILGVTTCHLIGVIVYRNPVRSLDSTAGCSEAIPGSVWQPHQVRWCNRWFHPARETLGGT